MFLEVYLRIKSKLKSHVYHLVTFVFYLRLTVTACWVIQKQYIYEYEDRCTAFNTIITLRHNSKFKGNSSSVFLSNMTG